MTHQQVTDAALAVQEIQAMLAAAYAHLDDLVVDGLRDGWLARSDAQVVIDLDQIAKSSAARGLPALLPQCEARVDLSGGAVHRCARTGEHRGPHEVTEIPSEREWWWDEDGGLRPAGWPPGTWPLDDDSLR